MEILRIHKLNEVFFQIECDDAGIKMELREHFSFFAQNYKFHPAYKARRWDGRLYLYDIRFSRLHIGLFWDFFHFCDERGYRIEFVESRHTDSCYGSLKDTVTPKELTPDDVKILDSIPFVHGELRDYQMNSIIQAISNRRQIILSSVGSGKSSIIYYLSLWHIQKYKSPVLIVVPTTGLVAQMANDFYTYAKGNLPKSFIHQIYSGQEKENIDHRESPVIISTWQSIIALDRRNSGDSALRSFLKPYGLIAIDETHTADAKSLTNILESATESNHRFGFTGTLKESKISELQLKGLLGNVYRAIHTHELQKRNELADLQIECHVLKYPAEMRQAFAKSKPEYQKEIDFILSFDERNRYICELALSLKGNTLILFQYVERHGKKIFQKLRDLCYNQPDRKLFFISGASPVEDRERMREIVEKEKNAIVVGSSQVLSTGVNIVNLENLIFASSTKSSIRVIQSIGRALRVSETKQKARLYDIVDDISWKSRKNYTLNHALKRIEFYVHEKFKYKMIDVDFDPNKPEQTNHD